MPNCLIIDDLHPAIFPILTEIGIEVDYKPEIKREEVLKVVGNFEGIVVRSKLKLDKDFFKYATRLKYIARAGSGKDNIDTDEADLLGIKILNAPEGNRDAVAEHTMGMLLNLLNNIKVSDIQVRKRIWNREANRGTELGHKTVAIIGYGNTGRSFSKRLIGFGCKVLFYDINLMKTPEVGANEASLEMIFTEADILSLHIPLNDNNKHLVTETFINKFAKPFWFLNTSRGELVNTYDLIRALKSNKILGVGLDVFENEKLETYTEKEKNEFEELASLPNVIFSPHIAGWTHESYLKISEVLGSKIRKFYEK